MAKVTPRLIEVLLGGSDRSDEMSKFEVHSAPAESDFTSFEDARSGGGREYTAEFTIAEDHASGSLLTLVFASAGTTAAVTYAPYGNEVPTTSEPHYTGSLVVTEPDGKLMGAEADESPTQVATIDLVWKFTAKPTKLTAAP